MNPLLQEVLDNPDDLDARLVYADFLMESGNPRGTFISHQVRLADMTGLEEEYPSLYAEMERIRFAHRKSWIDQLIDFVFEDDVETCEHQRFVLHDRGEYEDGFLDRLWLTPTQVQKYWDRIAQCEPVTGIALVVDEEAPVELEAARSWRKMRLHRDGWFAGPVMARILNWPLDNLQRFDCVGVDLGNLGARLLAKEETVLPREEWPRDLDLNNLTALGLRGCNLLDDETRLILNAFEYPELRVLDLRDLRINEEATYRVVTRFEKLQDLRISSQEFPETLVNWEGMSRLTHWNVPSTLTGRIVKRIFDGPSNCLRSLGGIGASAVAQNPRVIASMSNVLTDLCLSASGIGSEKFVNLIAAPSLKNLRRLHAFSAGLDDDSIEGLIHSGPQNLVELDLCANEISDRGIYSLSAWEGTKNIVTLNLSANSRISRDGFEALAKSPYLQPVKLELGPNLPDGKTYQMLRERFGDAV